VPRVCDELACDTHPLQCRGLELDMQETSATEGQHSSQPLDLHMAQCEPVMTNCCRKKGREGTSVLEFLNNLWGLGTE
jgi:hypothetical protein